MNDQIIFGTEMQKKDVGQPASFQPSDLLSANTKPFVDLFALLLEWSIDDEKKRS